MTEDKTYKNPKLAEAMRGNVYWTNGERVRRSKSCPRRRMDKDKC